MLSLMMEFNRASAARIALALDDAACASGDAMLIQRLARLKNMALDSRTKNWRAFQTDRRTLELTRGMAGSLRGGAMIWDVLKALGEIERGLYDRERKKGASTPLEEEKRRLFEQLRVLALEIDWLTARRQKLVADGAAKKGMNIELNREDFNACSRRLRQVQAAFEQTRQALRAMDSVLLLETEEAGLAAMERYYAAMPELSALEERQVRMEIQMEDMQRYNEATDRLKQEWEAAITAFAGMDEPVVSEPAAQESKQMMME